MPEKKKTISVAIAVYNEANNLARCLDSVVSWSDEIVLVDGGSTDRTIAIAKGYNARIIKADNPLMFHINKQKALDACLGKWILQLDADEVVTDDLKKEIRNTILNSQFSGLMHHSRSQSCYDCGNEKLEQACVSPEFSILNSSVKGYYIPRKNYFWGHFMKKGGQYPDYVMRLVKRGYAHFPCASVHEQIKINGAVGYLRSPLLHYSYKTKQEYWKKADAYTTLTAHELKANRLKKTFASWAAYTLFKPVSTFFRLFIRHKGFMDGWYGLVFAYWSALHFPIAYRKFLEL